MARKSLRILQIAAVVAAAASASAQQRPAAQQPVPGSRTEILTYDGWTVTCRERLSPAAPKTCSAELQIVQSANNANTVVLSWTVGPNNEGKLATVLRVPTGVLIQPGIEFKLDGKEARKIAFTACEPNRCEASLIMDDAFIRDASAAQSAEAVVYASDGRGLRFSIVNKGFAAALAAMRR